METFIAHNVISPYREAVLREFQRQRVPLNMDVEMPTVETIRRLVQDNEGVAFLPRMCVEQELKADLLREIRVKELNVERKIRLAYPARRALSHAAKAFLDVVRRGGAEAGPIRKLREHCRRRRRNYRANGRVAVGTAWLSGYGFRQRRNGRRSELGRRRNAGPRGEILATSPIATLAIEARNIYPSFVRELEEASRSQIDFEECGALDLAYSAEEWRGLEARAAHQAALGIRSEALDPGRVLSICSHIRTPGSRARVSIRVTPLSIRAKLFPHCVRFVRRWACR